jgi:hypothetical protein
MLGYPNQQTRLDSPSEGHAKRVQYTIPTEDFLVLYQRIVQGGENMLIQLYRYIRGVEKDASDNLTNPVYWTDGEGELSWFSDATSDHKDV